MISKKLNIHGVKYRFSLLILLIFSSILIYGQGDGPMTMLPTPKNFTIVNPVYFNIGSNINFATANKINDANINMDIAAVPLLYSFSLKGKLAQLTVSPSWVNMSGKIERQESSFDLPSIDGFGDLYLAMRLNLIGMPALTMKEFYAYTPLKFQLYAMVATSVPIGNYNETQPLNIGANRWMFRVATPMVFSFVDHPIRKSYLEITPGVRFFTRNDEGFGDSDIEKNALFTLESHFTHYFSKKIWASIDAGYQQGGETTTNDIEDDNTISQLAGGVSMGYSVIDPLGISASYGRIWASDDKGHMIRVGVVLLIPSKKDIREMKAN